MADAAVSESVAERASRWLAGRTTRRSFIGRLGRGAVLVASGSVVATLIDDDPAAARVCGQSGVAPKCPTYDCNDTWGWCWYATGCCANGGLKKICDCCAPIDYVHGYCPSGTNVKCIVESCGTDPRVQVVPTARLAYDDPIALSAAASRSMHGPGGREEVVLVDAAPMWAAVAAPFASNRGAGLLLSRRDGLQAATIAELQRLGTRRVLLFGVGWAPAVIDRLAAYGISTESVVAAADPGSASDEVGNLLVSAGANRVVCIEPGGLSGRLAAVAGAAAAAMGVPLVIGVDRAIQHRVVLTYLIGPEAAARAGEVAGGHPVFDGAMDRASVAVAELTARAGGDISSVGLVHAEGTDVAAGLLSFGAPILMHGPGALGTIPRDWMFSRRDAFRRAAVAGVFGALDTSGYYEVQSLVNGFDAHLLIGVAGQGLPVISQPESERPLGQARIAATGEESNSAGYWTSRAYVPPEG